METEVNSFYTLDLPTISILDYLLRILTFSRCGSANLILGIIYLDRINQNNPRVVLKYANVHRCDLLIKVLVDRDHDRGQILQRHLLR